MCTMKMLLIYGDSDEDEEDDEGSFQVDDECTLHLVPVVHAHFQFAR